MAMIVQTIEGVVTNKFDIEQLGNSPNAFREDFFFAALFRRNPADKRGFARIGETNQPNVRNQFKVEFNRYRLTGFAWLCKSGCAVGRGFEPGISQATPAALGDSDLFAGGGKILDALAGLSVADNGSAGNIDNPAFRR